MRHLAKALCGDKCPVRAYASPERHDLDSLRKKSRCETLASQ